MPSDSDVSIQIICLSHEAGGTLIGPDASIHGGPSDRIHYRRVSIIFIKSLKRLYSQVYRSIEGLRRFSQIIAEFGGE